jgi:aldehyde dehydrogenase (NAD+)
LAAHKGVDKVAFTGSTITGRKVMEAAAKSNLKKVSLELGGKSPHLVFESANIEQGTAMIHLNSSRYLTYIMNFLLAANWAALGILYNTGQDCTAGSRLYVQDTIYDKFVTTLAAKAKELIIGDGFDEKSGGGPVVRTGITDTLFPSESDYPYQGLQDAIRPCLELYRIR